MPGRTELLGSTQPDPDTALVHAEAGFSLVSGHQTGRAWPGEIGTGSRSAERQRPAGRRWSAVQTG